MIEFSASIWMHLSEAPTVLIIFMKFFNNKILKQNLSPVTSMITFIYLKIVFYFHHL